MNTTHLILLFLLAAGAVSLMMYAGLAKSVLEPKRARQFCPSCGRTVRDCRCRD